MLLEHGDPAGAVDHEREEALAVALLDLAGEESVRVVEALAAALVNGLRERPEDALESWPAPAPFLGLCEDGRWALGFERRLGMYRRVARRALRGSLADPTKGANAFHRIEASPPGHARCCRSRCTAPTCSTGAEARLPAVCQLAARAL